MNENFLKNTAINESKSLKKEKQPFRLKTNLDLSSCVQYFPRLLESWVTTCSGRETKKKSRRNFRMLADDWWVPFITCQVAFTRYEIELKWWNISLGGKHESNGNWSWVENNQKLKKKSFWHFKNISHANLIILWV